MAQEEKTIKFSATGNLSDFMKKMQADGKSMYQQFAKEAASQTKNEKERYKIIKDQISALNEQLKIEQKITREKLNRAKSSYEKSTDPTTESFFKKRMDDQQGKLNQLTDQGRAGKAASAMNTAPTEKKESVFGAVLFADVIKDAFKALRMTSSAGTGLDLLSPYASIGGGIAGGLAGSLLDAANIQVLGTGLGKTSFGTIGAKVGSEVSGFAADLATRHFRTRDEFDQSNNRYRALGGSDPVIRADRMGYSDTEVSSMMARVAKAQGSASGVGLGTSGIMGLSRGYGIDESVSLQAIGAGRIGGGNGMRNVQKTLGIAISEGLDRAKFTDAIQAQVGLMQQFSQTSNKVGIDDVNRTMFEFNRMGGAFGIGDPRSMSKISSINQGLSSPTSGFGAAMSYQVLSELAGPNANAWDIMKMQEKGLQTKGYLEGVLNKVKGITPNTMIQKFLLRGMNGFQKGQLSGEDLDTLMSQDSLGSVSDSTLGKMLSQNKIKSEGERLTTTLQRDTAEVTNAFIDDMMRGIDVLENQFVNRFSLAIDTVALHLEQRWIKGSNGDIVPVIDSKTPPKSGYNRLKMSNGSPVDVKKPNQTEQTVMNWGYK